MSDIYYEPGKYGLTVVAEAEVPPCYDFDLFVVWQDQHGAYRWGYDSGCSCPMPFEGVGLDDLPMGTAQDALTDLKAWIGDFQYSKAERTKAAQPVIEILEALIA